MTLENGGSPVEGYARAEVAESVGQRSKGVLVTGVAFKGVFVFIYLYLLAIPARFPRRA